MNRSWLARYPRAAPVLVFLLVAAITILSVVAIERGEQARDRVRLSRTADALTASLVRRVSTTGAYLRAGSALFETTGAVIPATFARFADELRLDQNFRGTEGIGWAPLLRPDQVPAFEMDASRNLGRPVALRPTLAQQPRRLVVPVYYLQPQSARNMRAFGFDMYSEPRRRAAMHQAVERRQPTASAPVVLQQEGRNPSPGFLIYMPVFSDPAERRLKGFIYSPFGAAAFLEAALPEELQEDGLSITLLDVAEAQPIVLAALGAQTNGTRLAISSLTVANRPYRLEIRSSARATLSTLSMITLLFGMAVASLLLVLIRLMARQAHEDQQRLAWFEEQNSIRDSLTRELNHRVKNTLANVLSIVALTRRRATSLNEFADSLDGRIRALSATHDLLTKSEWGTTPIRAVVAAELAPYAQGYANMIKTDGPEVELAPNDALSLGMALHELATNAAKYGALSQAGGHVCIRWEMAGAALARLHWTESGGPTVPEQRSRGFGTDLIQKIVAHELRHPVDLAFNPEGVRCTLLIPIRQPSAFAIRARAAQREPARVN
jgi:two-component sensor histidine kinase